MRTLKKVLALTLALATLFSLTAFAAYKDESKIDPDVMSAVNLVSSLKIMMGDENGFRPTDTIKRSEAAKMVYVLRTGGKTEADGWKGQNLFTDMKGHWAEGYVNYCASVGIIAGVGNKKFNPNGNVTGVELAKMLLVAAGYKADLQGYAGTQWANKVLADAESVGMFDGYDAAYMAAAPRQYAAQMFANALLRTNMAVYLSGELVTGIVANPVLVGTKYFGLEKMSGVPTAMTSKSVTFEVSEKPDVTFNTEKTNLDLRYQDITVVYNGKTGEVYDMYASGKSKVYNVNGSDVSLKEATIDTAYTLELPGYAKTEYVAADEIALYNTSSITVADSNNTVKKVFDNVNFANDALRFIDKTGDGKIDVVVRTNATYDVVSTNKAADGKFDLEKTTAFETSKIADYNKLVFVDTVAKGDVVKLTYNMAGEKVVAKVEPVKGVATVQDGSKFVVGGVKYSVSSTKVADYDFTLDLGKEYNIFTDGKKVVYATLVTDSAPTEFSSNIALVVAAQAADDDAFSGKTAKVQVVLATGETKIYEWGGTKAEMTALLKEMDAVTDGVDQDTKLVRQYALKDGKITLKEVVAPTDSSSIDYEANHSANFTFAKTGNVFTYNDKAVRISADTYFFMQKSDDTSKYVVVKGSELKADVSSVTASGVAYATKSGVTTLAFGYIPAKAPAGAATANYAIVTGGLLKELNADGDPIFTQQVMYLNGTAGKVELGKAADAKALGLYKVATDANGISTLTAASTTVTADKFYVDTLDGFGEGFILVGSDFIDLAADVKIFYLNKDADEGGYDANEIIPSEDAELVVNQTISYTLNKDGDVSALVVIYDVK